MTIAVKASLSLFPPSGGDFRVIFRTDKLEDKGLVASYGITHMSTISTVLYLGGGSDSGPNKTLNCPPNPSNDNN